MVDWLRGTQAAMGGVLRASEGMADSIASAFSRSRLAPSHQALRTGILCPGDGPPSGSKGSFQDYRGIILPDGLGPLDKGMFPLGWARHPRRDRGDFPIFLDWEEARRHVVIVGPAGSGKTRNLIAPWAIGGSSMGLTTIVIDTKGDMISQELPDAKRRSGIRGKLLVVRWDVDDPGRSWSWNPLSEVVDAQSAAQVAQSFLGEVDPSDPNKFFAERDHKWLRGLVLLVATALGRNAHPSRLYGAVVDQELLADLALQAPHAAYDLLDLIQFPSSEYARATTGLSTRLSWLADPSLAQMLSGAGGRSFSADLALDSGAVLCVGMRAGGGERAATAAALLLNALKMGCMRRFSADGNPVLWLIDEAPRVASKLKLDEMLDLLRGANSPVCVALQDVTQFGDETKQTRMMANCDAAIVLTGSSAETAQYFSKRFGSDKTASVSTSMDQHGRFAPTLSHQESPRLGVTEIMYPPVGRYGGVVQIKASSPHPFLISFDN